VGLGVRQKTGHDEMGRYNAGRLESTSGEACQLCSRGQRLRLEVTIRRRDVGIVYKAVRLVRYDQNGSLSTGNS